MVSQQPATMNIRVARGSQGLSPAQKAQVADFLERYRAPTAGNSKLVIAVPSGSPNESAAMRAVGDMRQLISELRLLREPTWRSSPTAAAAMPARRSASPTCATSPRVPSAGSGRPTWPTSRATCRIRTSAAPQQHNLAAQIANPADLLGPRTMEPADAERRSVVFDKYRQGRTTRAEKDGDEERVQVKGAITEV